jgi:hypothetical protein
MRGSREDRQRPFCSDIVDLADAILLAGDLSYAGADSFASGRTPQPGSNRGPSA